MESIAPQIARRKDQILAKPRTAGLVFPLTEGRFMVIRRLDRQLCAQVGRSE